MNVKPSSATTPHALLRSRVTTNSEPSIAANISSGAMIGAYTFAAFGLYMVAGAVSKIAPTIAQRPVRVLRAQVTRCAGPAVVLPQQAREHLLFYRVKLEPGLFEAL